MVMRKERVARKVEVPKGGGYACFGKWRCKEVGTTPPPEEGKTFAK